MEAARQYQPTQAERDYRTIREAIAEKPSILEAIVKKTRHEAHAQAESALDAGKPIQPRAKGWLSIAEKEYQHTLSKHADALFAAYQSLPVSQKIDLLAYSIEVGEANDKARELAQQQIQHDRQQAIAKHQAELARQAKSAAEAAAQHAEVDFKKTTIAPKPETARLNLPPLSDADNITNHLLQPVQKFDAAHQLIPNSVLNTETYHKQNVSSTGKSDNAGINNHIGLGNPMAVTVNLPVHYVPGLSHLNKALSSFEKTAHLSWGFTAKFQADNSFDNSSHVPCYQYKLKYIGIGPMSNTNFNVQAAPLAAEINYGADETGLAFNSTVFQRSFKHPAAGVKGTLNADSEYVSQGFAPEFSYVRSNHKQIRFLTTNTAGWNFGNNLPMFHIPHIDLPALKSISDSFYTWEDLKIIGEKVGIVTAPLAVLNAGKTAAAMAIPVAIKSGEIYDSSVQSGAAVVTDGFKKIEHFISNLSQADQEIMRNRIYQNAKTHFMGDTLPASKQNAQLIEHSANTHSELMLP